jgi:hypothetical protein
LAVGILIHVHGLVRIAAGSEAFTVWAFWIHVFMLAFNIVVLVGLVLRKKAAYAVFIAGLAMMAATWAIDALLRREINLSTLMGIVCCSIAVPVTAMLYRKLLKSRSGERQAIARK